MNQVLQGLAAQALHHDEEMTVVLANLVDGADVGMVQRRCGAGFAAEAFEGLGIVGSIVGQKLESDKAAQLGVFSFVDHTHAAAAEQFEDAVVGDGLADHGRWTPARDCGRNRKRGNLRRMVRVRQCRAGTGDALAGPFGFD